MRGMGLRLATNALEPIARRATRRHQRSTIEGRGFVLEDPGSVSEAERRYAARYKAPRVNPERVALLIEVTRVLGNVR